MRVRNYGSLLDVLSGGNIITGLAALYDTMEVRTAVTPPAVIDLKAALDPSTPASPVVQFLQPTILLSGPAGYQTIAPYGVAPDGTAGTIVLAALFIGLGYLVGWTARKRKHPQQIYIQS